MMHTMMPDDGEIRGEHVNGELLKSGEEARVLKELPSKRWDDLGSKTAYGPIMVGHRMLLTGRAPGEDLDTSAVQSAAYDGDDIVVVTMTGSRYKLEVKRAVEKKAESVDFTPMGIAKGIGQMIQDALRRY